MRSSVFWAVLSMTLLVWTCEAAQSKKGGPIPAANLPEVCNSIERCCPPRNYTGTPGIRQFEFEELATTPWRNRRPVHKLTPFEVTRLERAYTILRALPDSDPRSLRNQMNLHCLYCDNALTFPGDQYSLEIHGGWFFLPWHRMFLFWHERILAKVLDDDSFALPYWPWDNTEEIDPPPNALPAIYYNQSSSLWSPNRNNCSTPELMIDLDTRGPVCNDKTATFLRQQNARLLHSQLVTGAPTPGTFYGLPYYFGNLAGTGPGTLEVNPHDSVHLWVGGYMNAFATAGLDPVFYPHHNNIDRMWALWTKLPGGVRTFPLDQSFNDSAFTFYDENANMVKMSVWQTLDPDLLRFSYEDLATPWATNGVSPGQENTISLCNPLNQSATEDLINSTPKHNTSQVLGANPITFRIKRPKARLTNGTEILELSGIRFPDINLFSVWKLYLFFPQATTFSGPWCPEWAGEFIFLPTVGQSTFNPKRTWRIAIGPKLALIGKDYVKEVVFTMTAFGQNITFSRARIIYDFGPSVPL